MLVSKPGEETHLGLPHNFSIFANPNNQNELFSLGLFVVGVAHTSVSERGLGVVQKSAQLTQAARTRLGEQQFIRAIVLGH